MAVGGGWTLLNVTPLVEEKCQYCGLHAELYHIMNTVLGVARRC